MRIRPATAADRQDLQVLEAARGAPVEACVLGPQLDQLLADPERLVLVADSGRRVVGAVTARRGGQVEELVVDPEYADVDRELRRAVAGG